MNNKSFDTKRIAEGYANRPWLHKYVIEQIKLDYPTKFNYKNGLDVGCGAGLSTKALKLITDNVTGTDISEEMVNICKRIYNIDDYFFYIAKAEETIIPSELYDIVTAAGVINWVDQIAFFNNMNQVIKPNGLLIIYDFWITNKMEDNEDYSIWYLEKYLKEFPKPPRNEEILTNACLVDGLILDKQITYEMAYEFSLEEFVDFMMIQSNVNLCIANKTKSADEIKLWMFNSLQPIFNNQKKRLIFEGYNWYIRKSQ